MVKSLIAINTERHITSSKPLGHFNCAAALSAYIEISRASIRNPIAIAHRSKYLQRIPVFMVRLYIHYISYMYMYYLVGYLRCCTRMYIVYMRIESEGFIHGSIWQDANASAALYSRPCLRNTHTHTKHTLTHIHKELV